MSDVGQIERLTQRRLLRLLERRLGYRYLAGNSNVEEQFLREWLRKRGTSEVLITRALHRLRQAAALGG